MHADGIVQRYALAARSAPLSILSPLPLSVWTSLLPSNLKLAVSLVSPQRIFDYLKVRGGKIEGEYIVIAGWPVQFLPATSPLVEEALAQAVDKDVAGMAARVFTADISPPLHSRQVAPRTKLACSSLLKRGARPGSI